MANLIPILFIIITTLSGCAFNPSEKEVKSTSYEFSPEDSHWIAIEPDQSDYAYTHKINGSIFILNSICSKYDRQTLNAVSTNLYSGLKDFKIKNQEQGILFGREALTITGEGKMDGINFLTKMVTVKRDHCTYDFILISKTQKNLEVFNKLIESIRFKK